MNCWDLVKFEETQQKLSDSERFNKSGVLPAWRTLLTILTSKKQPSSSKKSAGEDIEMVVNGEGATGSKTGAKRKKKSQGDEGEPTTEEAPRKPKRKKIKHNKKATTES